MANTNNIVALLILLFFFSTSLADLPPTDCNGTPDPKFCQSNLATTGLTSDIHDLGRVSIRTSLSNARKFMALVDKYLARKKNLSPSAVQALIDCQFLSALSMDYLQSTTSLVSANNLPNNEADDILTRLSATLTNYQTCWEGLQTASSAWSIRNGIFMPLSNGTKLSSLSLSLFRRGWVHRKKKGKFEFLGGGGGGGGGSRKLLFSDDIPLDHLPLKMSIGNVKLFESLTGRRLLQAYPDSINVRAMVVVDPSGDGNFTTINDAVAAAPNNTDISGGYFLIYIVPGVYEEYVTIDKNKKNVMMIGSGINQTIITGNRSVVDGSTTFNSSTMAVVGERFVAVNITIRNTAGAIKHQAVAVRNGADLSTFYNCSIEGYQDTLYTHSMRQFYRNCDIYGTVDFIFGNAAVVLQNCNLYARLPMQGQFNAITAQGRTDPNQNTGTSIHSCTIKATPDLASSTTTKTYLGRPWKEYSRTVYMQSYMDSLIDPAGWRDWNGTFALSTLYYAEYDNAGPGSNTSSRVNWPGYNVIDATDANNFTVSNFIGGDGWLPVTKAPYQEA
ncbi:hypothetical protein Syun_007958 [Stephania yunnanensis]|uniref:Pectinesterase n=1 Tax=Stephania yunnanensis TaxID=152371 RepID=A0AAP0PYZ4_9MAGN